MKNLTDSAVITTARDLIAKNGKTTNLEIKMALRADDFYATQNEVAGIMDALHFNEGLEFSYNGTFREYFEAGTAPVSTSSSALPKVVVPHIPAAQTATPAPGDWVVSDKNGVNPVINFLGDSARNTVRFAYHLATGTDYVDTRAKRA